MVESNHHPGFLTGILIFLPSHLLSKTLRILLSHILRAKFFYGYVSSPLLLYNTELEIDRQVVSHSNSTLH